MHVVSSVCLKIYRLDLFVCLGVLCDISGVLKDAVNGVDVAIDQSVEAFKRFAL